MGDRNSLLRSILAVTLVLSSMVSISAYASFFGVGGTNWKEEALLHDGNKIIVTRSVEHGGRHELGQYPPYKEQSLTFSVSGTNQPVTWEDHYSDDIGSSSFMPMAVDIVNGRAYVVADTMGCLAYNKWGRPNPPYVVFRYDGKEWQRIPLSGLPDEIKRPNLIFSMPDIEVEKLGKSFVNAEMIQKINNSGRIKQSEHLSILREPMKKTDFGSSLSCPELVRIKGGWASPGGSKAPGGPFLISPSQPTGNK